VRYVSFNWSLELFTDSAKLDKLVISQAGFIAQSRLARGVKLNHTESIVESLSPDSLATDC
jgi:urease gamma subunit